MEVAVLPERRFCVPAPESHRSVALLGLSASWQSHIPFRRSSNFSSPNKEQGEKAELFQCSENFIGQKKKSFPE